MSQVAFASSSLTYEETIMRHADMQENTNYFGGRLAVHENLVVGNSSDTYSPKGRVSFYTSDGLGNYNYANTLDSADVGTDVSFGKSLDTFEDLVVVAAPSSNTGASRGRVFLFELNNGVFTVTDNIYKNNTDYNPSGDGVMHSSNFFGDAVGIYKDNEKIYVGVVDQGTKEIFIFEKNINTGAWNLAFFDDSIITRINSSNISINNEYIAIAENAPSGKTSFAKVHILENTNLGWTFKETISAPASSVDSHFSKSLDLSEDNRLVVGAWAHNEEGAVFIYELDPSSNFVLTETLSNPVTPAPNDSKFGFPVSIHDENILVGNTDVSGATGEKKFYKYSLNSGSWTLDDTISATDPELSISDGSRFAYGLGIYDSTVFASSYKDDSDNDAATMPGSIFRFAFPNLSNDGEPIPEFKDYVLFSVILISGFAIFRRLPSIKYKKLKSGN